MVSLHRSRIETKTRPNQYGEQMKLKVEKKKEKLGGRK